MSSAVRIPGQCMTRYKMNHIRLWPVYLSLASTTIWLHLLSNKLQSWLR